MALEIPIMFHFSTAFLIDIRKKEIGVTGFEA